MIDRYILKPSDYLDPSLFAVEKEKIFDSCWHPAGLRRDISNKNDWLLTTVAGAEIILQNFGDNDIRAFYNSCPHRFSAIRSEKSGNGALRCPYHLWSFDKNGLPDAVPWRGEVTLDECRKDALRLQPWHIGRCGELLFVARNPKQELKQFLGSLMEPLAVITNSLGDEIEYFEQDIAANWKIIMQNTVEFDHAVSVHRRTFAPLMAKNSTLQIYDTSPPHISYLMPMLIQHSAKPAMQLIARIFEKTTWPSQNGYMHWSLFPCSTLGTAFNHHLALIIYMPVAVDKTHATIRLFTPKFEGVTAAESSILRTVVQSDVAFSRQLLDEDKKICETVQRGMTNAALNQKGCLMPGDKLVSQWQSYWQAAINYQVS